jgi:hypothetical protein
MVREVLRTRVTRALRQRQRAARINTMQMIERGAQVVVLSPQLVEPLY